MPGDFCKTELYSIIHTIFIQVADRASRLSEVAASFTLTSTTNRFRERCTFHKFIFRETRSEQPRVCCVTVSHEVNTRISCTVNPIM